MNTEPSIGQRLRRFVALVAIIFTMTITVVVTQRLSTDALALLLGLGAGVVLMLPPLVLGVLVWRREAARQQQPPLNATPATPPVIVVTPQALPNYGAGSQPWNTREAQAAMWAAGPTERKFTIVGDEG
ncbi:MAG: hypothetical protein JXA33_17550 [Anaerolineae bacterium]|nr:hypothetical protein [Anaerolineae bacterium]